MPEQHRGTFCKDPVQLNPATAPHTSCLNSTQGLSERVGALLGGRTDRHLTTLPFGSDEALGDT